MNRTSFAPHHTSARLAAALLAIASLVEACGGAATPAPTLGTATPTNPATAVPTATSVPSASPTPNISIVPVPAAKPEVPATYTAHLSDATAAAMKNALAAVRVGSKIPGMAAAVMFPDGTIWSGVSGQAVMSPARPLTTDTLMSVGSISKTFVSALIGRLVADGKIGLDDKLAKYVNFTNASKITIRDLLDHTSGIRDLFAVKTMNTAIMAKPTATWTADQVLAKIGSQKFTPGTTYSYSNTNYILLGKVIEKVTGKSVSELVRTEFLTPLGMTHTFLQTEEKVAGPLARGYMKKGSPVDNFAGTMIPFTSEVTAVGPAGAYVSTASDLAIWANALYGGYVLSEAGLASVADISPTVQVKGRKYGAGYGLGFEQTSIDGTTAWGHRGHLDGFWSTMEYLPAYHVTVVILTNAEWIDPVSAAATIGKVALGG